MAYACNISTQVTEAGGYHPVQNLLGVHNEASLTYRVKHYLKQTNKQTQENKTMKESLLI